METKPVEKSDSAHLSDEHFLPGAGEVETKNWS